MDPPQAAATSSTSRPSNREASSSSLYQAFPAGTPGRQVFPLIDGFTGEIFTVDLRHPLLAASARRTEDSTFFPTDVHPTWSALRQFLFTRVLPALPSKLHASLPSTAYTFCNTSDDHRLQTERPGCHPGHSATVLASSGCIDRSSEFASHPRSSRQLGGTSAKNSVVLLLECTYTSLDLEVKRHTRSEEEAPSGVLRPGEPGPIFFYYSDLIFYFCKGEQGDGREFGAVDGDRESSQLTSHSEFLRAREATQNRNDADELTGRQGIASAPASALSSPYLLAYDSQASRPHLGRRDSLPSSFGDATASGDSWKKGGSPGNHPVVFFRLPYASPSLERRLTGAEQCAVQTAAALCTDTGLQHFASSVRTAAHLLAAGRARAAAAASLLQRLPQQRRSALVVQGNLVRHLELATSWLAALLRRVEDERRLQQPLIDGLDPLLNLLHSTVLPKSLQKPKQSGQTAAASSKSQPIMRTLADALDIETVHYHVDRVIAQREQVYGHLKALQSRCDEAAVEASAAGRRAVSVAERAGAVEEEALRIEAAGRDHEVLFHRVLEALPPPPIAYSQYSPEQLEERRERQTAALQELRKIAGEQAACEERLAILWARRGEEFARAVSRVFEGKMEVKREHNLGLMLREAAQRVAVAVLQFGRLYALPRACALALQECARRRRFRCTYTSAAKSAQTQLDEMRLNEEELRLRFLESCGHALPLSLFGALRQYEVPRVAVEGPEDFDTDLEMIGGECDEPDSIELRIQDKDDDSSDSGFDPPDKVNNKSQALYTFGVQTVARATYPAYHGQQGRMPSNRGTGGKTTASNHHEESEDNRIEKKLLEASTSESLIAATAAVEALLAGMLQTGAEEERDVYTRAAKADLQDLLSQWRLEATVDKDNLPLMAASGNLPQERRISPLGVTPVYKSGSPLSVSSDQKTSLLSSSCSVYGIPTIYEESAGLPLHAIRPLIGEDADRDDVSMAGRSFMETRKMDNGGETTTTDDDGKPQSSASSLSLPSKDRTAVHARQVGSLLPPESKEKPRIRIRSPCLSPVDREARMASSQLMGREVSEDNLSSANAFDEERDGRKLIAYDREAGETQGEGTTSTTSSTSASLMSSVIGSSSSSPSSSSSLEREKKDSSSPIASSLQTNVSSTMLSSSLSPPLPGNEDRPESVERRDGSSCKQVAGISDRFSPTIGKKELQQCDTPKEGDDGMGVLPRKKGLLSLSSDAASLKRERERDRKFDLTEGFEASNTQPTSSRQPLIRFETGTGYTRCISASTPFSFSSSLVSDLPTPGVSVGSSGSIPSSSSSLLALTAQGTLSSSTFCPSSLSTSSAIYSASPSPVDMSSSSVSAMSSSLFSSSTSISPLLSTLTEAQKQSVASTIPSAPARTSVSASCSASLSSWSSGSSSSSLSLSSSEASSSSLSYLASSSSPSAKAADVLPSSFSVKRDPSDLPSSSPALCFSSVASMSSSISPGGATSHGFSSSCLSPPIRQSSLRVSGPATTTDGEGQSHEDVLVSYLSKRESLQKHASSASIPSEKPPEGSTHMFAEKKETSFFSAASDEEQKERKSLLSDFYRTGSFERRLSPHSSPRDAKALQTDDNKHEGLVSDHFSESLRKEDSLLQEPSVSAEESLMASDSLEIGSQVQKPGVQEKIGSVSPVFSFDIASTNNLGREHEISLEVADREQRKMGEPINSSSPGSSSSHQSFERRSSWVLKGEEEKILSSYRHTSSVDQRSSSDLELKSVQGKEEEQERKNVGGRIPPRDVNIESYEAESSITMQPDNLPAELTKQKELDPVSPVRSLSLKLEGLGEKAAEEQPEKTSIETKVELNNIGSSGTSTDGLHGGGSCKGRSREEADNLHESSASNGETSSIVGPVQVSGLDRSEHRDSDHSGIAVSSEETPEEHGWIREEKQTVESTLTEHNVAEGLEVKTERDDKRKEGEVEGPMCVGSASSVEAAGSGGEEKPTTASIRFDSDKSVSVEGQQEVSRHKGKKSLRYY
ncbi:hypothetical protein CSUI_003304 [Cystoisospora suis]|uniref:Uncharacterized protein n=1 Tax=Cystoisospora suis TaxID=483139 RepID=A0A2C6L5Q6_9APIC|nr:hypothetical protein CSUI_003304 [Cystoisospora suis]